MTPDNKTYVIINADDFGYSSGVNRGILAAIDTGIVTSTSLMVDGFAAEEVKQVKDRTDISLGLHLSFTQEGLDRWFAYPYFLTFSPLIIEKMFMRQVQRFQQLVGRLPDHIDGHHHIHRHPKVAPIVNSFCQENKIPQRAVDARFLLGFYGRSFTPSRGRWKISPHGLIALLSSLQPGQYELMCHPAFVDQGLIDSNTWYLYQREIEEKTLTDPAVVGYVEQSPRIALNTWNDVAIQKQ